MWQFEMVPKRVGFGDRVSHWTPCPALQTLAIGSEYFAIQSAFAFVLPAKRTRLDSIHSHLSPNEFEGLSGFHEVAKFRQKIEKRRRIPVFRISRFAVRCPT